MEFTHVFPFRTVPMWSIQRASIAALDVVVHIDHDGTRLRCISDPYMYEVPIGHDYQQHRNDVANDGCAADNDQCRTRDIDTWTLFDSWDIHSAMAALEGTRD